MLTEIEAWYKEELYKVLSQSAIAKPLPTHSGFGPAWSSIIDDGRFWIDNNPIENTIRPVALKRKNYLFAGSHDAAQRAAIIYSLLASYKMNDIESFKWLKETLSKIPDYPAN